MRKISIQNFNHPLYEAFETLYTSSFLVFEQRTIKYKKQSFLMRTITLPLASI